MNAKNKQHINSNQFVVYGCWQNHILIFDDGGINYPVYVEYCTLHGLSFDVKIAAGALLTSRWQCLVDLKKKWTSEHSLYQALMDLVEGGEAEIEYEPTRFRSTLPGVAWLTNWNQIDMFDDNTIFRMHGIQGYCDRSGQWVNRKGEMIE